MTQAALSVALTPCENGNHEHSMSPLSRCWVNPQEGRGPMMRLFRASSQAPRFHRRGEGSARQHDI